MIIAQHGYAASDRVEKGLQDLIIDGAVISASNVKPEDVQAKLASIIGSSSEAFVLFDSEYYVNFMDEADKFGKLTDYKYFKHPKAVSDLASPRALQAISKEVIDNQVRWGFKKLTSPSIEIPTFGSANESYSLSLLNSTIEYVEDNIKGKELYGSILLNEAAFNDLERMGAFLDILTRPNSLSGYYLVVDRTGGARPFWENPQSLAAYMYFINVLAVNKKDVVLGYCDGTALLGLAVGASHASVGWWQNSTNFTKRRFIKSGGRRRKEYYSKQLMNSIHIDGELVPLIDSGLGDRVANSTKYDDQISINPNDTTVWTDEKAILHKWTAMYENATEIAAGASVEDKLKVIEKQLLDAQRTYRDISSSVPGGFDSGTGPNKINVWLNAISLYEKGVL